MLTAIMVGLSAVALATAVALVTLTSQLHRAASSIGDAVESVRLAELLERDLLLHDRSLELLARADLATRLRRELIEARRYVGNDEERVMLEAADTTVKAYLATTETSAAPQEVGAGPAAESLERAFSSLEQLVQINSEQAAAAAAQAARWDHLGDILGVGAATALVLGVGGALLWLHASAFRPVSAIADAMRRLGGGERSARALEKGPLELRIIARQFNEMATSLAHYQQNQLAFLAGVAHDLRNPLSALTLSTAQIADDRPLPGEERVRRVIAIVRRQSARLDQMLGDLLDAARVEAGHFELRPEERDCRVLVGETYDLYESISPVHRIALRLPPEVVPVRCDEGRMAQVLNNLLSNAIKYSPRGGRVEVAVQQREGEARIEVSDDGIGLSLEDQAQIFEPFHRAEGSAERIPGAGLGLFVARRIVEAHGGRITVTSAPGAGSTFRVHLPLASAHRSERLREPAAEATGAKAARTG